MISFLNKCLEAEKACLAWGAMLDILRNAKNATMKAALYSSGSEVEEQSLEICSKFSNEKTPRGVGLKGPEILRLLRKFKMV